MEKQYKAIFGFWAIALVLICAPLRSQTPGGANGVVFRFTKQVWLNPSIILAKQNFEQSTNVKLLILPRLNSNDTVGNSKIEKAFDMLLSFLVFKENVQGSIKFYFNPKNPYKPFTFNTSEELKCKFTPVQRDSVETILNKDIVNSNNLNNFTALPFDSIINRASRYCKRVLQSRPGPCGDPGSSDFTLTKINSTPAKLNFEKGVPLNPTAPNGGVDKKQYGELEQYYNVVLDVADNSNYPLAWKAMTATGNDVIKLKLKKKDPGFDLSRVVFKNANGTETYNVSYSHVNSDSTIDLGISGKSPGSMAEVVAYYTPTTTPTQTFAIGAFNVQFYEPKTFNVVLVDLGNASLPNANAIKDTLNKIYGQAFIKWNVTTVSCPLPANINKNIHIQSSGLLSNYMPDMQPIVNHFKDNCTVYNGSSDNTYYLLFGTENDGDLLGYMPMARNTGFIFSKNSSTSPADIIKFMPRTIAHELGHGAFNLKHIFSSDELGEGNRSLTDNLMDYKSPFSSFQNTQDQLYKYQWDLIHNPGFVGWFEGDDEDAALTGNSCDPSQTDINLRVLAAQSIPCGNSFDTQFEPYRNQTEKLKKLCFTDRLNILKCLATGYMDDEDQEGVISLIYTTPKENIKQLFDSLKKNTAFLLREILSGTSGSEYNILIDALVTKSVELYGIPTFDETTIKNLIVTKKFVAFDQWKANNESYSASGNYFLSVRRNFHLCCQYNLVSDPFQNVLIRFDNDFSLTTGARTDNYQAGTFLIVPAIFLPKLVNEADNRTIRYAVDIIGMYFGFTELKYALQGGKALTFALLDIGISATDIAIGVALVDELNKTNGGQKLLNGWNTFAMYYGLGRGSSALYLSARNYYILAQVYRQKPNTLTNAQKLELQKSIDQAKEIINENGPSSLSSADNEITAIINNPNSWLARGFNNIDDWVKTLSTSNKTVIESTLNSWNNSTLTSLNNKLALYSGLKAELTSNVSLLNYFNKLETTWWAKYGLRKLAFTNQLPLNFKNMINDITVSYQGKSVKLIDTQLGDLGSMPLGKIFDEEMENIIRQGWKNNTYTGLSAEVINRLNTLKTQGYELVIKPKLSIDGNFPEPDLIFVKKVANSYNFSDCIYIDNKYFYDVAFTPAQNKIVNAFNSANEAVVSVYKSFVVNGTTVSQGQIMKIKKVEIFTIGEDLNLSNVNKKP